MVATNIKSSLLDEDVNIEELNTRTTNLAFNLKMLTQDEKTALVSLASVITFEELMSVINIFNPKNKDEKIKGLQAKYDLSTKGS